MFICPHDLSRQCPLEGVLWTRCGCLDSPWWTLGCCCLQTLLRAQRKVSRRFGLGMWTSIIRGLRVEKQSLPFWPRDSASLTSQTNFSGTSSYLCQGSRWHYALMKINLPTTKDARDNAVSLAVHSVCHLLYYCNNLNLPDFAGPEATATLHFQIFCCLWAHKCAQGVWQTPWVRSRFGNNRVDE